MGAAADNAGRDDHSEFGENGESPGIEELVVEGAQGQTGSTHGGPSASCHLM